MRGFVKNSIISTGLFMKDNKLTVLFMTLFTLGTVIGSFALSIAGNHSSSIVAALEQYFNENATLSIFQLAGRNLISNYLYLLMIYVCGLCAIGLPVIAIIPILKGVALGTIISYQYIFSGIKGFIYTFIIILIPSGLMLAVFNFAYAQGMYMSLSVSNGIFNSKPRELKHTLSFTGFTKRFIIFAIGVLLLSFLEAVLTGVFSKVL